MFGLFRKLLPVTRNELLKLQLENKQLRKDLQAAKRMESLMTQFLGPEALKLFKYWKSGGLVSAHFSWGPEAHKMTGEERAKLALEIVTSPRKPWKDNPPMSGISQRTFK